MFALERLDIIKKILLEKKKVDVSYLSEILSVSEVTVRRDLDKLEKDGFLIKTYGGAMLNTNPLVEEPPNTESKEENNIAQIASTMIHDDDIIFLSGGSIGLAIANSIKDKQNVIVLTNDIFIAAALYNQVGIHVKLTGGDLKLGSGILMGVTAINSIKNFLISKAFLSVKGVHLDFGYTLDNLDEVSLFEQVAKISKEVVITADSSKFDKVSLIRFIGIDAFKKVITNNDIPDKYKDYYYSKNIKIYTTYELDEC